MSHAVLQNRVVQTVVVQKEVFDATEQYDRLLQECPGAAVVTFTGYVRDHCDTGGVGQLELEHYPGMTESVLEELGRRAKQRFNLKAWRIIHRYGVLDVNEPIVWTAVIADHRSAAFDACQFLMDSLKTDAPFWKREHMADGSANWVAAKNSDSERSKRWQE